MKGEGSSLVESGPLIALHCYQILTLPHKGHPGTRDLPPAQKTPSCNLSSTNFPCSLGVFFPLLGETGHSLWARRPEAGQPRILFRILCSTHELLITVTISRAPGLCQALSPVLSRNTHGSPAKRRLLYVPTVVSSLGRGQVAPVISLVLRLCLPINPTRPVPVYI